MIRCWRCGRVGRLVFDPLMLGFPEPPSVCPPCAVDRHRVLHHYLEATGGWWGGRRVHG